VSLADRNNDRDAFLAHLLLALESVEPGDPESFEAIVFTEADLVRVVIPRLAAMVAQLRPFVLVVDDAHALRSRNAVAILREVVECAPEGSCVALAGRSHPPLPLARWRAERNLVDLELDDLAMSVTEGTALLRGAGADVTDADAVDLVAITEGWPAGLYLSTLALRVREAESVTARSFDGRDRAVAEYFLDEVLTAVPAERRDFLVRTSVLDRLSGAACDALLDQSGSSSVLDDLGRSNLFVVPLGRSREWYRYHHLFRDLLRGELRRREPELERVLHARASAWCEAQGDADGAISHARAAGDDDRASALVWSYLPMFAGSGRTDTVLRWLDEFGPEGIAGRAPLAVSAAWAAFSGGDIDDVARWAGVLRAHDADELLPDGTTVGGALSLLDALLARDGLARARDAAAHAYAAHPTLSAWRPLARVLGGLTARLLGCNEQARLLLDEGLQLSVLLPPTTAHCAAQLALLAADEGTWAEAETLIASALQVIDANDLHERPAMCHVYATASVIAARAGRPDARDLAKHGAWLTTMLRGVTPILAIEARVLVARALTQLGEVALARALVDEAAELVDGYPDSGRLPELVAEARDRVDAVALPLGVFAAPLTPAEMRILRYLPTHLSFAEIADAVYVSRNTVKTQAIAVYRKLGVSSRAAAVDAARVAGLLDP
jgi:LuxR family maltose regulon positive regulatory protein